MFRIPFSPSQRALLILLLLGLLTLACGGGTPAPQPVTPPQPVVPAPDNLEWAPPPPQVGSGAAPVSAAQAGSGNTIDILLIADSDYSGNNWQTTFFADAANLITQAFPPGGAYTNLRQLFRFYVEPNVRGNAEAGCVLELDATSPGRTLASFGAFYEAAFILHTAVFPDCSTANSGPKASSEKNHYLTFLHELGHVALALADEYNSSGGYWVLPKQYGPPNLYTSQIQCQKAEQGTPVWSITPTATPHPPYSPTGACKKVTPSAPGTFYRTDPATSDSSGLLMRRAGPVTPPAYATIIARAGGERVEWAKLRCAAGLCSDVAWHNCPTAGSCAVTTGHEPILTEDKESIDPTAPGAVRRRAVVLTLSVDAEGDVQVLDQQLVEDYARTHELAAFPYWRVEVISADERVQHQFSIWDPRLRWEEFDEEEPLRGQFHIIAPVTFDLVFDLRDFADARSVRLTYPGIADPLPPESDAGLRTTDILIDRLTPTTLVVGWPARFQTLDPVAGPFTPDRNDPLAPFTPGPEGLIASSQMLEPLVRLSGAGFRAALLPLMVQMQAEPLLAESWEIVDDFTWIIQLRPNILFHNGEPLTAEAVALNIERWRGTEAWQEALQGNDVAEVTIRDELTLQILLAQPDAAFINRLGALHFGIHSPSAIKDAGGTYGGSGVGVVGTGPFRFAWNSGNRLLLQRNPDYWAAPAGVDEVMFLYLPDVQERWLRFRQGELDLAAGLTGDVLDDNPEGTPFAVLSDFYRYGNASLLVGRVQPALSGWAPDSFGAESYAALTLQR